MTGRHGPDARDADSDPRQLSRLRWRCRRGMLENDLMLEAMLVRLLDLPDGDLWDLISGKAEPDDPTLLPLVRALRAS